MILLTLDTNTHILSCSITENEKLISEISIYNSKNHSINSIDTIDAVLKKANLELKDVDGFVISKGPGSFTGLRIAFSIVKAFSYSLNKPMISLSSLDCLCFRENFNGVTCSIIDALRDEVYINSFENKNSIIENTHEGDIVHIEKLHEFLLKKHKNLENILFTGMDLENFEMEIKSQFKNAFLNKRHTTAYDYAILGLEKFKLNMFDDSKRSIPSYIRVSQAQENLIKQKLCSK